MNQSSYDVILAGGGVIGAAIAYNLLKKEPQLNIVLVERDSSYVKSSTVLSDGNCRIQFNLKENIEMSLYALNILADFDQEMAIEGHKPHIAFRQQGNIFVVDDAGKEMARQGLALQKSLGCEVDWLMPAQIKELFPPFDPASSAGATFSPNDGTMSPLDVLLGYRGKAISLGASMVEAEISQLVQENQQMCGVCLTSGEILYANVVVNCAGAWAPKLADTIGVNLPIKSIKRQVYSVETEPYFDHILPLLILPTGQYCLHEGGNHFVTGGALPDDPDSDDDFSWSAKRFEERLWEGLISFLPQFDRLKVLRGWAGLYAVNTLDGNAILGEWPEIKGLFLANGFSGHGFQQCHAVGRYLAELILGQTPSLDLSIFSPRRVLDNKPVFENPARII